MSQENVHTIAQSIVYATVTVCLTVLMALKVVSTEIGVPAVLMIAGVWVKIPGIGGNGGSGSGGGAIGAAASGAATAITAVLTSISGKA